MVKNMHQRISLRKKILKETTLFVLLSLLPFTLIGSILLKSPTNELKLNESNLLDCCQLEPQTQYLFESDSLQIHSVRLIP